MSFLPFYDAHADCILNLNCSEARKSTSFASANVATFYTVLGYLESVSLEKEVEDVIEQTHSASVKRTHHCVTVDIATLQNAEFEIVRKVQAERFSEEIKILRYLK